MNTKVQPRKLQIPRGDYVFREGEVGHFAYILESGALEVVRHTGHREQVLAEVEEGSLFGEMALIDDAPRSASVRVKEDAVVIQVDKPHFLRHISQNPQMALNLMTRLSGYVRNMQRQISASALDATAIPPEQAQELGAAALPKATEVVEDTDALYEASPAKALLMVGGAILSFALVMLLWLSLSFVDVTVSARGKMTTKSPNVVVQATDNSVIEALLVERGNRVKKGEVVARLDGTFVTANLAIVDDKIAAIQHRISRIRKEQAFISGQVSTVDSSGLDEINAEILNKRMEEYRTRLGAYVSQLEQIKRELQSAETDLGLVSKQIEVKRSIEAANAALFKKKAGSYVNLLQAQDVRLAAEREQSAIRNHIATLESKEKAVQAEREVFVADRMASLAEELSTQVDAVKLEQEEKRKLERQKQDLFVRSPVNGIVLDLPKVTAGSIVREGEPIVTLVRSGVALALEVDIDPKDVSDLRLGAPVSVKLDALPFQQYGDLEGRLEFVSNDTFGESLQGRQGAYYRGRVTIDPRQLQRLPSNFHLSPGMLASADMKVNKRRLITYFTNPILRTLGSAMREPD